MTPPVTVTVWTDYICPWAYGARHQTEWLRGQGVEVRLRAYELHPEIPPEGRPVRPGGRLDGVFDHIAEECATRNQPFVKPTFTPNSHLVLEVLELVVAHHPNAVADLDDALATAYWVDGSPIDDRDSLRRHTDTVLGQEASATLWGRWADGEGQRLLEAGRDEAHELGVTATPAWRIGELTVTGLHPDAQFERWMTRVIERTAG
ncbi:MAG: DsbA family protein [Actinomycetota bacterium]